MIKNYKIKEFYSITNLPVITCEVISDEEKSTPEIFGIYVSALLLDKITIHKDGKVKFLESDLVHDIVFKSYESFHKKIYEKISKMVIDEDEYIFISTNDNLLLLEDYTRYLYFHILSLIKLI